MTHADILAAIPKCNLWFSFGHGLLSRTTNQLATFECWNSHYPWDWTTQELSPSDVSGVNNPGGVPNVYNLVFFDSCNSADGGTASQAFVTAFNANAYVGWSGPQNDGVGAAAAPIFFTALEGGSQVSSGVAAANTYAQGNSLVNAETLDTAFVALKGGDQVIDLTPSSQ